jgi:hypothetical protein
MLFTKPMLPLQALLSLPCLTSSQLIATYGNTTLPSKPTNILGNLYNYWLPLPNSTYPPPTP